MLMGLSQNTQFILGRLRRQLVANNQTAIFQHLQGIVKRCLTDMKIRFFQFLRKQAHVEMTGESAYTF